MTLDDRSGRMEVMLFSDALERYAELLEQDKILVVSGQVSFDDFNGGLKMTAREVMDLGAAREKYARGLSISMEESQIDEQFFERFSNILEPHKAGTCSCPYILPAQRCKSALDVGNRMACDA